MLSGARARRRFLELRCERARDVAEARAHRVQIPRSISASVGPILAMSRAVASGHRWYRGGTIRDQTKSHNPDGFSGTSLTFSTGVRVPSTPPHNALKRLA